MRSSTLAVREARDEEHERCRTVLPQCFLPGAAPELFVASDGEDIRGVAAVLWSTGGFPLQLFVFEPFRRRGIGRALVDAVVDAAHGETGTLRNWFPVVESSAAAAFLSRMGFAVERRLLGFDGDSAGFVEQAVRLRALIERSGRVPDDARIITLGEAPRQEVAKLVAAEFGTAPAFASAQLQTGAGYDPSLCVVATHGGRVVGAVLAAREGPCLRVDVTAVAPDHRGGWANLLLLTSLVERGIAAGVSRFRFFCDEDNRDTLNIARRAKANALERALMFRKTLA